MLRVGLTGGIACGKSTVGKMFAALGAHMIDADAIAHELYRPGEAVYQEVVKRFGPGIVQTDGQIDRARLAALAFGGGRVEELNKIVHPAVIHRQEEWMSQAGARQLDAVAIVEAALIFEAGANKRFDKMIVVTCTSEQKIARYAERTGLDRATAQAEVDRRMKAQLPEDEKVSRADYVIDNSGALERTRQQVEKIFAELKVLARQ